MRFVVPTDKRDVGITYCKTPRAHRHVRYISSPLPSRASRLKKTRALAKVYVNFVVARRVHDRDAHLRNMSRV